MTTRRRKKYLQATTVPPPDVPHTEQVTTGQGSYLGIAAQLTGLSATLSLLCSVIYDYGYFSAIQLSFSEIPISINDHIRSSLLWLPFAALCASTYLLLDIWDNRRSPKTDSSRDAAHAKMIIQAYIEDRSIPAPLFLKISSISATISIILVSTYQEHIPWIIKFILLGFSLALIWMHFSWWLVMHPRIIKSKSRAHRFLFIFGPIIIAALSGIGYGDARRAMSGVTNTYNITLKTKEPKNLKVKILRNYEKFVFINYSSNRTLILPQEEVIGAEKIQSNFSLKEARTAIAKIPPKKLLNIIWNSMER